MISPFGASSLGCARASSSRTSKNAFGSIVNVAGTSLGNLIRNPHIATAVRANKPILSNFPTTHPTSNLFRTPTKSTNQGHRLFTASSSQSRSGSGPSHASGNGWLIVLGLATGTAGSYVLFKDRVDNWINCEGEVKSQKGFSWWGKPGSDDKSDTIVVDQEDKGLVGDVDADLREKDAQLEAADKLAAVKELPEIDTRTLVWEITKLLGPDWLLILAIIAVTGAAAAINIYTPNVIGDLVTTVQSLTSSTSPITQDPTASLMPHAMRLLTLTLSQGILTAIDIALVTRLGERLSLRMRRSLWDSILRQDVVFFDARMQGEIVGRLTQDVAEFKHTFKLVITQGLKCIAQVIGSGFHLFRISSTLTVTLLSVMPFLYIAMNLYGIFLRRLSKSARVGDSKASGVAGEAVSNIRTVKAFAAEHRELEHYMNASTEAANLNNKLGFHIGLFQGMTNASIGGMILLILFYGGSLVGKGDMTAGQLMSYMVSTQNAQRSLALVGVLFGQVVKALGSAARVFEFTHLKPTILIDEGSTPQYMDGLIEFKNVQFRYPTRPEQKVLESFNLRIPVGKVVALCGASGSGKSTVGQLIERFYDPESGSILIDGRELKTLSPSWIREHVGYINQEPILFATTIFENIRYGCPNASQERVEWAAKQANAAEFISKFPKGYDTVVGERGVTLSGGQKQRIAIARALLKNPKVLILDEATSALDSHSERVVQEALEKLMQGRTVLVIAHRLSTIQNADLIVVMSASGKEKRPNGNVVETGTHDELLRKRGAYYELYQKLMSDV
ncbi:ATP-binding cassette, sub-B (MDR TAP), member 8 [Blyttiomyces sp. JEL0837]|nr:ATP-binding cassette, sub-B (MDR TAP), member 8 [Blyttiomyces sp. JEL0837]